MSDLAGIAAAYRRSYRSTPSAALLLAAQAHLELVMSLQPRHQADDIRRGLLTIMGEMAALAAAIHLLDRGRPHDADPYLNLAWQTATTTGNADLQSVVLGGRSFSSAYASHDHRAGLDLAEHAFQLAGEASAETRGWVAALASERAASLGDLGLCQRYIAASRTALADTDSPPTHSLAIGSFNDDKLKAYEGGDMVRLGRFQEAEAILDQALERLAPTMHRHRCTALIDRAEARLAAGHIDAACADATDALEVATHIQHAGNMHRLSKLARQARDTDAAAARKLWIDVLNTAPGLNGTPA